MVNRARLVTTVWTLQSFCLPLHVVSWAQDDFFGVKLHQS